MSLAALSATLLLAQAAAEEPIVKCVLILPPATATPWKDAHERLETAMKDIQWWYACQMEAYGYGMKTFGLETDENGKLLIHEVRMPREPEIPPGASRTSEPASGARSATIIEAEKVVGNPRERKGSVMMLVYDGYYWTDRVKAEMLPMGFGLGGRWAHVTGWHLYGLNSKLFRESTPIPELPLNNPYFQPLATQVYQAFTGDGTRTVGERASASYGAFIHEIGHAFGLHHPPAGAPKFRGDIMTGDFWNVRGNFLPMPGTFAAITPEQAAHLDKNPLFKVRKVSTPSTGASKELGARGAFDPKIHLRPNRFAKLNLTGQGFTIKPFGFGKQSQSNRDYVWKELPPQLNGYRFTQTAGGKAAEITLQAITNGRVYVSTAADNPPALMDAGWEKAPFGISYVSQDGKREYKMPVYFLDVRARAVVRIPQLEWTGTIVIAP